MFCLHYVYPPRIYEALTNYKNAHNHHKISSEGLATPLQLFTIYIPNESMDESELSHSIPDQAANLPETSVVTIPRIHCPLSAAGLLEATIDPLSTSTSNGRF